MWIVYNCEDAPDCGWGVASEKEAKQYCLAHPNYKYVYIYLG